MTDRWVVLDAMGVVFVVGDDTRRLLVPFVRARVPEARPERIAELYRDASLGRLAPPDFWNAVGLGHVYPDVQREYLDTQLTLDPWFAPAAELIARRYRLAMLSNDVAQWSAYLRRRHRIDDLFETCVISGDVGVRKPDPRIYQVLLQRIGAPPADCVFVDDSLSRLAAAADLGLHTIHFAREDPDPDDPFRPDATVRSFTELAAAVERVFPKGTPRATRNP